LALAFATGCASDAVTIAPRPPAHYERLGPTKGSGCGVLVLGFLPIQMASRVERAYAEALTKAPGSTALANTELWERYYFWLAGVTYCTSVEGTALRASAQ
jgi:hypothetical protein